MGFQTVFMHIFHLRERVMDLLEQISGNRVNYSMNRIGGVNRDIGEPAKVLDGVAEIRRIVTESIVPLFTNRCHDSCPLQRRRSINAAGRDLAWCRRSCGASLRVRYGSAA